MDASEGVVAKFITVLNVGEATARILVAEGFGTIDAIAYVPVDAWRDVSGIDASEVVAIRQRARDYLLREARENEQRILGNRKTD